MRTKSTLRLTSWYSASEKEVSGSMLRLDQTEWHPRQTHASRPSPTSVTTTPGSNFFSSIICDILKFGHDMEGKDKDGLDTRPGMKCTLYISSIKISISDLTVETSIRGSLICKRRLLIRISRDKVLRDSLCGFGGEPQPLREDF